MDKKEAIEDISYIRQVMVDARTATHDFGKHYMVWAGAVILGMIVQMTLMYKNIHSPLPSLICWIFFMGSALIWDIRENRKRKKEKPAVTFANSMLNAIWATCLTGIITVLFIWPLITQGKFIHGTAVITLIMGIGHYVTGELSGSRNLKGIGVLWFISFIPILILAESGNIFQMAVLFAFLMFVLQFIPGFLHSRAYSNEAPNKHAGHKEEKINNTEKGLEDISYIKQLLNDTRSATLHFGAFYILWSILIVAAIGTEFTLISFTFASLKLETVNIETMRIVFPQIKNILLASWLIFIGFGILWSIKYSLFLRRSGHTRTFANRLVGFTWLSVLISIILPLFLIPIIHNDVFTYSPGIIALLLGVGHYITGELCESKFLKFTGIAWWLYSMALAAVGAYGQMYYLGPLFAIGMILFQLLPGFLISKQFKKAEQEA